MEMTAFYCDSGDVPDAHCYEETYSCSETGEPCHTTLVSCPAADGPCTTTNTSAYYGSLGNHVVDTEVCYDDQPTCEKSSCEGYEC